MDKKNWIVIAVIVIAIVAVAAFALTQNNGGEKDDGDKVVTIVTNPDFAPYEYMVGDTYEGIDMDIWRAIAKSIGYELQINYMEFDSIINAIQNGKYDVGVSGFTITEDRKESVNFTSVYDTAYQAVIVKAGSDNESAKTYTDLKGNVSVETGTTGNYIADALFPGKVSPYNTYTDVFTALIEGNVDFAIVDNLVAVSYVTQLGGLTILEDFDLPGADVEEYGFALNKKDTKLLNLVNTAMDRLTKEGVIDDIKEYYKSVAYSPEADGYFTAHPEALKAVKTLEQSQKTISIVTNPDFAPYEYMVGDTYEGIDMDIWRAITKTLGYDLKINYMEFDSIITAVQNGRFDVGVSGFTITEDRKDAVNFTSVYDTAYQAVIVKAGSDNESAKTYTDLKGNVSVETGTTGNYIADALFPGKVNPYNTYTDVFNALIDGKVDFAIVDNLVAVSYVTQLGGLKILENFDLPGADVEEYGFALNKKDTELLSLVNQAMEQLTKDHVMQDIKDYYASVAYSPEADGYFTVHPEALSQIRGLGESKKVISIVTNPDFAPYEYMVGDTYEGIDMDIWRAIAKTLGYDLKINYMEFDSIITAVQNGRFDVGVSGFTITEDRKDAVNFTSVYDTAYQAVIVRDGTANASAKTYKDLTGNVSVETGTTGNYIADDLFPGRVTPYNTYTDVFNGLLDGKVDFAIVDNLVAVSYVMKLDGLVILENFDLPGADVEEYGFALNKSDTELLTQVNKAMAQLTSDGVMQDIKDYYKSVAYDPEADGYFTAHPEALKALRALGEEKKVISIVTNPDFAPYEYMVGDTYEGIDMDIWRAIAKTLGYELKINYMEFDSIITAVQNGRFDVGVSGFTITEDRKEAVNFTSVYDTAYQAVIVRSDSANASAKTYTDLKGNVSVETGTTGNYIADDLFPGRVTPYNTYTDVFNGLLDGKVDFAIVDNLVAVSYVMKLDGLVILENFDLPGADVEEYGFALNKKNTDLLSMVNQAMSQLTSDGVMQDIKDYYKSVAYDPEADGYFTAHPEALKALRSLGEAKKTITIVTNPDFAPYEYMVGDTYEGIDMDIWRAIAKTLGYDLDINYMEFDSIITAVQNGRFDVGVSGFTITEDRKEAVNFTSVYDTAYQAVIVRDGTANASAKTYKDLTGNVSVETGTTGNYIADDLFPGRVTPYNTYTDVFNGLIDGKVDFAIVDNLVAVSYVMKLDGLKILEDFDLPGADVEEYGFALNKENTSLLNEVNRALAQITADGVMQDIKDYYKSVGYDPEADGYFTTNPDALKKVRALDTSKRTITVVTNPDFAPYEYLVGDTYEGIDMDIWRAIAEKLNANVEFHYMEFDSIVNAVMNGKYDVGASGFTITEDRKEVVNFTSVYDTAYQAVIVRTDSANASAKTYTDLSGKVSVETGTTGNYIADSLFGSDVSPYNTYTDVFNALVDGKVDFAIVDNLVAVSYVTLLDGLTILEDFDLPGAEDEEYGFVLNMRNTSLLSLVNKAMAELEKDGVIDDIKEYYKSVAYSPEADGYFTVHPEALDAITVMEDLEPEDAPTGKKSASLWERIDKNLFQKDRYKYIVNGLENTLIITAIGLVLGLLLGIFAAIVRSWHDLQGNLKILNAICKVYITVIRGTPTMVQLLIIYFIVFSSSSLNALIIAGIAFGINSGAYVAEIIRAGINAVPKSQLEGGLSLGMPFSKVMTKVILPQAIRNILPALCNEGITLLKETSIAGYIGVVDLTKGAMLIRSQTYDAFVPLILIALIYLVIVLVLQYLVGRLERRLNSVYR